MSPPGVLQGFRGIAAGLRALRPWRSAPVRVFVALVGFVGTAYTLDHFQRTVPAARLAYLVGAVLIYSVIFTLMLTGVGAAAVSVWRWLRKHYREGLGGPP